MDMTIYDLTLDRSTGDIYFVGSNLTASTTTAGILAVLKSNGQIMKLYDNIHTIFDVTLDPYNR